MLTGSSIPVLVTGSKTSKSAHQRDFDCFSSIVPSVRMAPRSIFREGENADGIIDPGALRDVPCTGSLLYIV
jgi:hypothetical protein